MTAEASMPSRQTTPALPNAGLAHVRVLELAGNVGVAWAAKLFADLGADVIRVEDGNDMVRSRPHNVHRWLNSNKRSVQSLTDDLIGSADLVIHDRRELADLTRHNSRLVVLAITPFGLTGPYAHYEAAEINAIHASSWGNLSPGGATDPDLPPLKAPGHHANINVATVAAVVALAAVERAAVSRQGEHIDFSAVAAAAKITEVAPAAVSFLGVEASRLGTRTVVPWGIFQCADGLLQLICPEQSQWEAFVELMGSPEWASLDVFATGPDRTQNSDLVNMYLAEWFADQHVDDIYHAAQAARIAVTPVNTMAQLEADGHFAERGFFATTPDGLKLPGPGFQIDQPWWNLAAEAPDAGAHEGEGWLHRTAVIDHAEAPAGTNSTPAAALGRRPLEGVRVCDFTWIWAGPFCTQVLAHLGADVIKLESSDHLCMFRRLPLSPPDSPPSHDTSGLFQIYNTDKRSISIDLSHADAAEVVARLVAVSDVVIDNFGVGVMDRLGFGAPQLRAINPDVVIASLSGYGSTGPCAEYVAYGPAGGALAGLYASNGYQGGPAFETGVAIGDPCTGITAAWAVVASLAARRRTGIAATIDVAMAEAVAATVGEGWMQYLTEGRSPAPIGNHDPIWSPHNCYRAQGDDQWVTIACTDEPMWHSLCAVMDPGLAHRPGFADAADRKRNEAELDAEISAWTKTRDRWHITEELQAVGVTAFPSLSSHELWTGDVHFEAIGMLERPPHPLTGERVVPGVPWRLRDGPNGLRRPAPLLGEHTFEILTDVLGYAPDVVDELIARRVVREPAAAQSD
ncbi:CoA transferase [Candidatus Poriferisodalis sp.]|uniref:CaiB/BaiF CoA-transferase family protein n=1 Tax=Candidatus Poriferisodalis sp. TaxID=3101277 RepID=UPI003D0AF345